MHRFVTAVMLCSFLFLPAFAFAAVAVRITTVPAYPTPGYPLTLTANSGAPKGTYYYQWVVNGSVYAQGADTNTITLVPGKTGSETSVDVALIDAQGTIAATDSYIIRPGSVDLIWEGTTYVPPFYRGKPYPTGDSSIVLQAIPHIATGGGEAASNDLIYSWAIDGKALPLISGYGKSTAVVRPTSFKSLSSVAVTVSTRDGFSAAKTTVSIPTVSPKIVMYQDLALSGVALHTAVGDSIPFSGEEMTFWAVPFFVTDPSKMTFSWTVAGQAFANDDTKPATATFRKNGGGNGASTIGVTVRQNGHIFEGAAKTFKLSFE